MIVVVSHAGDDHAAQVVPELARLGCHAQVIDTGSFPRDLSLIARYEHGRQHFSFVSQGREIPLDECRAAWWRRPQPYTLHDDLAERARTFTYGECHEAIAGLWASLPARWMNEPQLDSAAHHKPYQLTVAARVGLTVARTLITSDPGAARAFIGALGPGRTIYKTFLASAECWRETRVVQPDEVALLDALACAPVIFQEYVPADVDLRVTIVGPHVFAAAIRAARGGYEIDYRMDMPGASFEPTTLPPGIEQRLRTLMERLGLRYGAIDLRRTPDGEYVFLEVNPAGEWLFVEERTGQPITSAVAGHLAFLDAPSAEESARTAPARALEMAR